MSEHKDGLFGQDLPDNITGEQIFSIGEVSGKSILDSTNLDKIIDIYANHTLAMQAGMKVGDIVNEVKKDNPSLSDLELACGLVVIMATIFKTESIQINVTVKCDIDRDKMLAGMTPETLDEVKETLDSMGIKHGKVFHSDEPKKTDKDDSDNLNQ